MRWIYGGGVAVILVTFLADMIGLPVDYWRAAAWSLTLGAAFVTVFTILYGSRSNWRSNRIGKIFLAKSVLLSAALWQIVATTWIGQDYPYRHEIRFVVYAVLALAYATMDVALIREQNADRALHPDEPRRHSGPPL